MDGWILLWWRQMEIGLNVLSGYNLNNLKSSKYFKSLVWCRHLIVLTLLIDYIFLKSTLNCYLLFQISFSLLFPRPVFTCGGILTGESGFIGSEGFPGVYPPNSKCTWKITVSIFKKGILQKWILEPVESCCFFSSGVRIWVGGQMSEVVKCWIYLNYLGDFF